MGWAIPRSRSRRRRSLPPGAVVRVLPVESVRDVVEDKHRNGTSYHATVRTRCLRPTGPVAAGASTSDRNSRIPQWSARTSTSPTPPAGPNWAPRDNDSFPWRLGGDEAWTLLWHQCSCMSTETMLADLPRTTRSPYVRRQITRVPSTPPGEPAARPRHRLDPQHPEPADARIPPLDALRHGARASRSVGGLAPGRRNRRHGWSSGVRPVRSREPGPGGAEAVGQQPGCRGALLPDIAHQLGLRGCSARAELVGPSPGNTRHRGRSSPRGLPQGKGPPSPTPEARRWVPSVIPRALRHREEVADTRERKHTASFARRGTGVEGVARIPRAVLHGRGPASVRPHRIPDGHEAGQPLVLVVLELDGSGVRLPTALCPAHSRDQPPRVRLQDTTHAPDAAERFVAAVEKSGVADNPGDQGRAPDLVGRLTDVRTHEGTHPKKRGKAEHPPDRPTPPHLAVHPLPGVPGLRLVEGTLEWRRRDSGCFQWNRYSGLMQRQLTTLPFHKLLLYVGQSAGTRQTQPAPRIEPVLM
ncbi:putative Modular polyketide synthase [Streptomyces viridochromogenes Tue57]|uniref:Putative Modular polyketide synthase n=1 Tax=Streptomyces viridochromogenes Tue57 TaxID=1160705 RepID=L8PKX3_STRVR|nr:putative Modular polyketide synthase [Streptomyces viridochromogenes Tue57]